MKTILAFFLLFPEEDYDPQPYHCWAGSIDSMQIEKVIRRKSDRTLGADWLLITSTKSLEAKLRKQ